MSERRFGGDSLSPENRLGLNALNRYIDQINQIPIPKHEEQLAMAKRVQTSLAAVKVAKEANNPPELAKARTEANQAVSEMALRNLRLVPWTIKLFKLRIHKNNLLELIQGGNLGLLKSIEKFDYKTGISFSTYSVHWIRESMQHATKMMRSSWRKSSDVARNRHQLRDEQSRLEQVLGGSPRLVEVAEAAHVDLREAERIMILDDLVYLDAPLRKETDSVSVGDLISNDTNNPEAEVMALDMRQTFDRLLDSLDEPAGLVLRLRFGFKGEKKLTLVETSQIIGVSRETIRQIEKKALNKLRWQYGEQLKVYLH